MSHEMTKWAWRQETDSSVEKIVLVNLADRANDEEICWPSQERIANECRLTRQSVNQQIRKLVEHGLISVFHDRSNGHQRANIYKIGPSAQSQKPESTRTTSTVNDVDSGEGARVNQDDSGCVNQDDSGRVNDVDTIDEPSVLNRKIEPQKNKTPISPPKKTRAKPEPADQADDPAGVPIPAELDTPAFREIWTRWLPEREKIKRGYTVLAAELQLKKLIPFGPVQAIALVERAIIGRYQGIVFANDKPEDPADDPNDPFRGYSDQAPVMDDEELAEERERFNKLSLADRLVAVKQALANLQDMKREAVVYPFAVDAALEAGLIDEAKAAMEKERFRLHNAVSGRDKAIMRKAGQPLPWVTLGREDKL